MAISKTEETLTQNKWLSWLMTATAGLLFLALTTEVRFYLPFSPVPLSLHPLSVFLIGTTLGSRRGLLAVAPFFVMKAMGFGPSAGYWIGMIGATGYIGWASERGMMSSYWRTLAVLSIAALSILIVGMSWLGLFVGAKNMVATGLLPFLPGDLCKVLAAATVAPWLTRFAQK